MKIRLDILIYLGIIGITVNQVTGQPDDLTPNQGDRQMEKKEDKIIDLTKDMEVKEQFEVAAASDFTELISEDEFKKTYGI